MSRTTHTASGVPPFFVTMRQRWEVVLVGAIVGALLAFAYSSAVGSTYTSVSRVLLFPAPGNPLTPEAASASGTQLTIAMETESGIVRTPEVAAIAGATLGREVPGGAETLRVRVQGGTQVVEIRYTSVTPERAAAASQAFSDAFLAYRAEQASDAQTRLLDNLRSQAATADENLRRAAVESTDGAFARQEVELFTERLAQLNERISQTEAVATDPGRVINPAVVPTSPNELSPVLLTIVGVIFGTMLGALAAMLLEWRRDLVRQSRQTDVAGLAVFASLPSGGPGLVSADRAPAVYEAYRRLLTAVVANGPRPQVLAVAAVDPDAVISDVVSNLAVGLANARFSVLVVAADADDRGIEQAFSVPSSPGLSELVNEGLDPRAALRSVDGVTVLAGGLDPGGVQELYTGPVFRNLVDSLRPDYDYIILAASSAGTGDGDAVIAAADSVLLSVSSGHTTYGQVTGALDRLDRLGIQPIGAVLTPSVVKRRETRTAAAPSTGRLRSSRRVLGSLDAIWPDATIRLRRRPALFSSGTSYVLLPSASNPSQLAPVRPRRALRAAMSSQFEVEAPGRLRASLLRGAATAGAGPLLPNTLSIRPTDGADGTSLITHIGKRLDRDLAASVYLGSPRSIRKPVLQMLDHDGATVAFVKVGINEVTRDRVRHERNALDFLSDADFETLRVPEILDSGSWRDCEYLTLSALPSSADDTPDGWVRSEAIRELVRSFETSEIPLSSLDWWTQWSERLGGVTTKRSDRDTESVSDAVALRSFAARLEMSCGDRPVMVGAAHGDWTPWNMTTVDHAAYVWDWESFDNEVPVGWDSLHYEFRTLVRLGGLSPREALHRVGEDAERIVSDNGADPVDGPLLMALYALRLGSRFVVDDQRRTGPSRGPLSQWLLPALEELITRAERSPVDA